jgi:UDP-glucose 4-epimerase
MDNRNAKAKYWIEDIRKLNDKKSLSDEDFQLIFHLAALARIQPSFKDPIEYLSVDSLGTAHVLEYARTRPKGKAKVVYAGSSSAFGGPMLNPYAFAKHSGEETCKLYSHVYALPTVIARFFNVYGKRQPTSGEYATIIGIFENLSRLGKPLTITGVGEQRRDFTHVSDIVSGLIALAEETSHGQVFQLGTGRNYSINQVASMFGGEKQYIAARPGEAETTLADISAVTNATGWSPKVTLEEYIEDFKKETLDKSNYVLHHPV